MEDTRNKAPRSSRHPQNRQTSQNPRISQQSQNRQVSQNQLSTRNQQSTQNRQSTQDNQTAKNRQVSQDQPNPQVSNVQVPNPQEPNPQVRNPQHAQNPDQQPEATEPSAGGANEAAHRAALPWASDRPPAYHSQTVGPRGPILEQDSLLHETLETFVHEKLPERPVHVKGFGAFGYFQTVNSMAAYTKLCFLQQPGRTVPVTVRFSLAVSNKGTPDTSRNVRGFSTKFYTEHGVFDLLCNHIPVFLVRDPIRFPESIRAFLPSPVNNLIDPERFWSFVARAPESTHFVVRLYSDAGTVKSVRHIPGHSVNTFVWRNAQGARAYVKYRWIPLAGEQVIDSQEAARLACENPDYAAKDLFDTLAHGRMVEYALYVQLMNPQDEAVLPFDPLDDTKVWDDRHYPLIPVGRLVLNRNPDNYKEQVEKLAFSPSNLLDGVELSDDKMLQGRANIYWDSQRHRLGPEFRSIPINREANWSPASIVTSGEGRYAAGHLVRSDLPKSDNFTQAGQYYRSLPPVRQDHLVNNLASDLAAVSPGTQSTVLSYLSQASAELGDRVARRISKHVKPS